MADVEHDPRPPYRHHAGFYRKIMPGDDLKPWEWSLVTDHPLPKSLMKQIFQISKACPPGLSGFSAIRVVYHDSGENDCKSVVYGVLFAGLCL